jgi:hypothetical protein
MKVSAQWPSVSGKQPVAADTLGTTTNSEVISKLADNKGYQGDSSEGIGFHGLLSRVVVVSLLIVLRKGQESPYQ